MSAIQNLAAIFLKVHNLHVKWSVYQVIATILQYCLETHFVSRMLMQLCRDDFIVPFLKIKHPLCEGSGMDP